MYQDLENEDESGSSSVTNKLDVIYFFEISYQLVPTIEAREDALKVASFRRA